MATHCSLTPYADTASIEQSVNCIASFAPGALSSTPNQSRHGVRSLVVRASTPATEVPTRHYSNQTKYSTLYTSYTNLMRKPISISIVVYANIIEGILEAGVCNTLATVLQARADAHATTGASNARGLRKVPGNDSRPAVTHKNSRIYSICT